MEAPRWPLYAVHELCYVYDTPFGGRSMNEHSTVRAELEAGLAELERKEIEFAEEMARAEEGFLADMAKARADFADGMKGARAELEETLHKLG